MAWTVTPETSVSEAAMFHGAVVTLDTDYALSTGLTTIQYETVIVDTDGFFDAANYRFVIPEGVSWVEAGAVVSGTNTAGASMEVLVTLPGVRHTRAIQGGSAYGRSGVAVSTGPLKVSAGESISVQASYATNAITLLANNVSFPNKFWIKVIKNPVGHSSSTLP